MLSLRRRWRRPRALTQAHSTLSSPCFVYLDGETRGNGGLLIAADQFRGLASVTGIDTPAETVTSDDDPFDMSSMDEKKTKRMNTE